MVVREILLVVLGRVVAPALRVEGGKDLILAEKPGKRGHPSQGERPDQEGRGRDGHHSAQPPEPPHIDHSPHPVHHRACPEEQQCLEEGVGDKVEDRGGEAEECAGAEACEHEAELADRRVCKHTLEVVLHRADQGGHERSGGPDDRDDCERLRTGHVEGRTAGHEVDTGCHHRGGMDQGAGGGGALHGIWEPDMQGQLRALAAGGQQ